MKRTLVSYKTKPEATEENARLIAKVFDEVKALAPAGIRYITVQGEDGTFVHFIEAEEDAISVPGLESFRTYLAGIKERLVAPPAQGSATIVGSYGMGEA